MPFAESKTTTFVKRAALLALLTVLVAGGLASRVRKHSETREQEAGKLAPGEPVGVQAPLPGGRPAVVASVFRAFQMAQEQAAAAEDRPGPSDDPRVVEPSAEDYMRKTRTEPRDAAWADVTARTFEEDLRTKGEQLDFRVQSVDCRSKSCIAELKFSSLREARADFKATLGPPNRPDCHERLLLPPDGDEAGPAIGTLILDCTERRARDAMLAGASASDGPK